MGICKDDHISIVNVAGIHSEWTLSSTALYCLTLLPLMVLVCYLYVPKMPEQRLLSRCASKGIIRISLENRPVSTMVCWEPGWFLSSSVRISIVMDSSASIARMYLKTIVCLHWQTRADNWFIFLRQIFAFSRGGDKSHFGTVIGLLYGGINACNAKVSRQFVVMRFRTLSAS